MGEKMFNLTWNNHLANLSGLFETLYKSGSLTDVTLACQGGMLRAHRLVLAACSPYFERVFKEHYGDQPILILKGVAVEEMECLLDFMYRGSIDVAEEHLPSLIKTATDLEIRGLSGEQKNQEHKRNPYARVEARMQRCHIEPRVHTTEYIKDSSVIPFLPKHSNVETMEEHKVEDIEVEDDPMVIDDHEDSFDELPQSMEAQIKRIPPPMFKRETRFKGQKRVCVGRVTRNSEPMETRSKNSSRESSCEDISKIIKGETSFNDTDIVGSNVQQQETSKNIEEPLKPAVKRKLEILKKAVRDGKEPRMLLKSERAQHKPFSCDLCTLAFTRASHLARHRRVHTGERPFACSICPRMFARQDKLKQHLDSHLQWPKRRTQAVASLPGKGKRGRPRKVNVESSAMEEILKFGEFSSLLDKSHLANSTRKQIEASSEDDDRKKKEAHLDEDDSHRDMDNYGCQVENGQDIL